MRYAIIVARLISFAMGLEKKKRITGGPVIPKAPPKSPERLPARSVVKVPGFLVALNPNARKLVETKTMTAIDRLAKRGGTTCNIQAPNGMLRKAPIIKSLTSFHEITVQEHTPKQQKAHAHVERHCKWDCIGRRQDENERRNCNKSGSKTRKGTHIRGSKGG